MSKIDQLRAIVNGCQADRVVVKNDDGSIQERVKVDLFSASAIVQVYDALNDANKAIYTNLSIRKMAAVAFKLCK